MPRVDLNKTAQAAAQNRRIVLTSINPPTDCVRILVKGTENAGGQVIIVGDIESPATYPLVGARFYGVDDQHDQGFRFGQACPLRTKARKNIGYLIAMHEGADFIQETDDDNAPRPSFFAPVQEAVTLPVLRQDGWVNVYRYFTHVLVWPRGLPLDRIHQPAPAFEALPTDSIDCPIQVGLADIDPDVDAIFRMAWPGEIRFVPSRRLALAAGTWSPFNSQNTVWFPDAYPLMYLPIHCDFRMTDIWRSFVAQRIAWANDWGVLFHEATVWQERNAHDLTKDFASEVPGYLNNAKIADGLKGLPLKPGKAAMADNLLACYGVLIGMGLVAEAELPLLRAWLYDLGL